MEDEGEGMEALLEASGLSMKIFKVSCCRNTSRASRARAREETPQIARQWQISWTRGKSQ